MFLNPSLFSFLFFFRHAFRRNLPRFAHLVGGGGRRCLRRSTAAVGGGNGSPMHHYEPRLSCSHSALRRGLPAAVLRADGPIAATRARGEGRSCLAGCTHVGCAPRRSSAAQRPHCTRRTQTSQRPHRTPTVELGAKR